ncbi:hypothetical protein M0R45_007974 [Rubus argutus]|uniref:Uncharacterized protein n=1 Tax=Rubus argutus TaxID=59490 RepID=A0AAW1XZD4_RUBAR
MGKEITLEAPNEPEPRKRRRLCFYDDVCDVLTKGNGTDKIKGIMPHATTGVQELQISEIYKLGKLPISTSDS